MRISAKGISATFDPFLGILTGFETGGSSPLHTAPWVGREAMPPDAAPHLARLGGDFFCAPFAGTEDGSALHGWPPNSACEAAVEGSILKATLGRRVQGARLAKEISLRDGHPFVYQRHIFEGGQGAIAVANHANVSLPTGGTIHTSPKAWWQTPASAPEPDPARGRSALTYPAKGAAPRFPAAHGTADLTRFPWGDAHEDFVCGIEAEPHALGWTAVVRIGLGDLFVSLRNAGHLPMTMLWHSNGGRDYPPWSGRHKSCLGVEEGAALSLLRAVDEDQPDARGMIHLGGRVEVCHVIGVVPWPTEEPVQAITLQEDCLSITGQDGATVAVPTAASSALGLA